MSLLCCSTPHNPDAFEGRGTDRSVGVHGPLCYFRVVALFTIHYPWQVGCECRRDSFFALSARTVKKLERTAAFYTVHKTAIETLSRQRQVRFPIECKFGAYDAIVSAAVRARKDFVENGIGDIPYMVGDVGRGQSFFPLRYLQLIFPSESLAHGFFFC